MNLIDPNLRRVPEIHGDKSKGQIWAPLSSNHGSGMPQVCTCTHTRAHTGVHKHTGPEVGRPRPGLSSPVTGKSGPPGTWGHLGPALMAQACQKVSKALRVIVSSLRNSSECCLKEQRGKRHTAAPRGLDLWLEQMSLANVPLGKGP